MYIWMVLATFMVLLAAFNLSPRSDIAKIQRAPLAQASMERLIFIHKAAVKYVKAAGNALNTVDPLEKEALTEYLPQGFVTNTEEINDGDHTYTYCLNKEVIKTITDDEGNKRTEYETRAGWEAVDCGRMTRYVITFARVPERWKNVSNHRVLGDYYKALTDLMPPLTPCGIVSPRVEGDQYDLNLMNSDYIMTGISMVNNSIPPFLILINNDFAETCLTDDKNDVNPQYPCLICVSVL